MANDSAFDLGQARRLIVDNSEESLPACSRLKASAKGGTGARFSLRPAQVWPVRAKA
jgi:hypothetical protein